MPAATPDHLHETVIELFNGNTIRTNTYADYGPGALYVRTTDAHGTQTGHWLAPQVGTGTEGTAAAAMAALLTSALGAPLTAGWHGHGTPPKVRHPDAFPLEDPHYRYDDLYYPIEGECIIQLTTGWTLRCEDGDQTGFVRVCTPDGGEEGYWHVDEWADPAEVEDVLGALLGAATGQGRFRVPD